MPITQTCVVPRLFMAGAQSCSRAVIGTDYRPQQVNLIVHNSAEERPTKKIDHFFDTFKGSGGLQSYCILWTYSSFVNLYKSYALCPEHRRVVTYTGVAVYLSWYKFLIKGMDTFHPLTGYLVFGITAALAIPSSLLRALVQFCTQVSAIISHDTPVEHL